MVLKKLCVNCYVTAASTGRHVHLADVEREGAGHPSC